MLNIGKLAAGGEGYYLDSVARGVEDYYVGSGEAPGEWLPTTPNGDLGVAGRVDAEALRAVLAGVHPATGERLRSAASKVPGFDLTFRAPKSVSLLYGLGDPLVSQTVRDAHDAAVLDAVGYLQRNAASSRCGHAGASTVEVTGLVAAAFRHRTSRAGDPTLHTHILVANLAQAVDDRGWRTVDAKRLYAHARTAGFVYQAALRDRLTRDLAVAWQPVRNGVADLDGVPREVIEHFSQRRAEILAALAAHGATSAKAAQVAALATRRKKDYGVQPETLYERWRARAAVLRFGVEQITALLGRERRRGLDGVNVDQVARRLGGPDGLTAHASTFTRRDVIRAWAEQLPRGGTAEQIEQLADATLHDSTGLAVQLLPHATKPAFDTGVATVVERLAGHAGPQARSSQPLRRTVAAVLDHSHVDSDDLARRLLADPLGDARDPVAVLVWRARREALRLGVPVPDGLLAGRDLLRRGDGRVAPTAADEPRYSTPELLLLEQRTLDRALARTTDTTALVPAAAVDSRLADGDLSVEQQAMVRRLTTSGAGVDVVVGHPGAGKTTALLVAHHLWRDAGHRVLGTALAARAAAQLQAGAGIPAATLDRLLLDLPHAPLTRRDVVVVDEAGMVGTRKLAALLGHADRAGAKVVLVGDTHQLPEIDAGGLYRALVDQLPAVHLTGNHRQRDPAHRHALDALRRGDTHTATRTLHQRGIITDAPGDEVHERLVEDWWAARQQGRDGLMLAPTLADVEQLNALARARLAAAGRLHGPTLTTTGGRELRAGDHVAFARNHRRLGVLNGTTGIVRAVEPTARQVAVHTDDGHDVTVPAAYLDAGDLRHAYATTGTNATQTVFGAQWGGGAGRRGRVVVGGWGWVLGVGRGWGRVVEGDAQLDVDVPASDLDVLDEQAHEALALREVELVEGVADAFGEAVDAFAQLVVGGELAALSE